MKKLMLVFLVLFISAPILRASNQPVQFETQNGDSIEVMLLSEGNISLFSSESLVLPATIPQEPMESYTQMITIFYVAKGENDLVEINCSNYKSVLREHMNDKPSLSEKIGQKGFKFSNLEEIVERYNQQ